MWAGESIATTLRRSSAHAGDRLALVAGRRRLSHAELTAQADRLAAGLAELGLGPGDRVVVHLPNDVELVTLTLALLRIGAVPVMALPTHREEEITQLCEDSAATGYVTVDQHFGFDHREVARRAANRARTLRHVLIIGNSAEFTSFDDVTSEPRSFPEPASDDIAVLLLSGGTTGSAKLIPRTHDDYAYNFRASAELCALTPEDRYLSVLPIAHNFALACPGVLGALHAGAGAVLTSSPDPADAFRLIAEERVTVAALVPPVAKAWMDAAERTRPDLSSLRMAQVGGSRLAAADAERLPAVLGCRLQQVFGMAEGLLNFTRLDDPAEVVEHTQGRPLSAFDEIRIVDEDDNEVSQGDIGELQTRGPYTITGYYRAPETNARAFTADGFFRTGDLVRRDDGGNLAVQGRLKDVINRGGDKIAADEVERHLTTHPKVRSVAVVPVPDAATGEGVCAFVVPDGSEPSLESLIDHLRARGLATYKFPQSLHVTRTLPLTGAGKVDKKRLAARAADDARTGWTNGEQR